MQDLETTLLFFSSDFVILGTRGGSYNDGKDFWLKWTESKKKLEVIKIRLFYASPMETRINVRSISRKCTKGSLVFALEGAIWPWLWSNLIFYDPLHVLVPGSKMRWLLCSSPLPHTSLRRGPSKALLLGDSARLLKGPGSERPRQKGFFCLCVCGEDNTDNCPFSLQLRALMIFTSKIFFCVWLKG